MNFDKRWKTPGAIAIASVAFGAIWLARGRADEPGGKEKIKADQSEVGATYRVPYRLTETNHALVRMRIDGKGPFNMLVDTGAPALFLGTEAAAKIGLKPSRNDFWTKVGRLEFEGGPTLDGMKGRIEDIYQLVGMNALGLAGAKIDGVLGFTVLARFRIEYDLTKDRMIWTRLDFNPEEPFVPPNHRKEDAPAEVRAMDMFGSLAKIAGAIVGKQPEDRVEIRGRLGIEFAPAEKEKVNDKAQGVRVAAVLADTPAAQAGMKPGDAILKINDRQVGDLLSLRLAAALVKSGDRVALLVRRGTETLNLTLNADSGL